MFHGIDFCQKPLSPRVMMDLGMDPLQKDKNGDTALHLLVAGQFNGYAHAFIDELCRCEPRLVEETNNEGSTPLHVATDVEFVKLLWKVHGADPTVLDVRQNTPLMDSVQSTYTDITEYMAQNMSPDVVNIPGAEGWMALHRAVMANKRKIVSMLLQNGADPNAQTQSGLTPLYVAVFPMSHRAEYTFWEWDVKQRMNRKPIPAADKLSRSKVVGLLLKHGADATIADHQGNLPFCLASMTCRLADAFAMVKVASQQVHLGQLGRT